MNICFFNLTEIRDGKTLNGVDRVASVLAAILRSRGARVDFYTPPPILDFATAAWRSRGGFSAVFNRA